MQFNEPSKAANVRIIRAKWKAQMGEQADRIGSFSDDKIFEMHEKRRGPCMEKFRAKLEKWRGENPDWCGKF